MEERKKRITRKYMRDRANISQSDMLVPEDFLENERVLDSEKYKHVKAGYERHETSEDTPPPPARRPARKRKNNNWLVEDMDTEESSATGSFFSDPSDQGNREK